MGQELGLMHAVKLPKKAPPPPRGEAKLSLRPRHPSPGKIMDPHIYMYAY